MCFSVTGLSTPTHIASTARTPNSLLVTGIAIAGEVLCHEEERELALENEELRDVHSDTESVLLR